MLRELLKCLVLQYYQNLHDTVQICYTFGREGMQRMYSLQICKIDSLNEQT